MELYNTLCYQISIFQKMVAYWKQNFLKQPILAYFRVFHPHLGLHLNTIPHPVISPIPRP